MRAQRVVQHPPVAIDANMRAFGQTQHKFTETPTTVDFLPRSVALFKELSLRFMD